MNNEKENKIEDLDPEMRMSVRKEQLVDFLVDVSICLYREEQKRKGLRPENVLDFMKR